MAQVRDYNKLATDIIEAVGGDSNIVNMTHCATRLRLVLKETPADANDKVAGMPGIITVVENSGNHLHFCRFLLQSQRQSILSVIHSLQWLAAVRWLALLCRILRHFFAL